MKRRNFILMTIAGAAAWANPGCTSQAPTTLSHPLFLSSICDAPTLRHIGNSYRTTTPAEAYKEHLISILSDSLPPGANQIQQIDQKIKEDYAAGKIVTIDGWVISITEARQCALYSLQNP